MEQDMGHNGATRHPFALRAQASAEAFRILAEVFGYPSVDCAEMLVSDEVVEQCRLMAAQARWSFEDALRYAGLPDCGALASDVEDGGGKLAALSRGKRLRVECTRLYWSYPRLVRLEGRCWSKHPGIDENAVVRGLYCELGLRNKLGVNVPSDALASELDYAGYVLHAESAAWDGDDSLSALEWHQLALDFLDRHLRTCALGVSAATLEHTANVHLRFYAALLAASVA